MSRRLVDGSITVSSGGGAPSILTSEFIKSLCKIIEIGTPLDTACAYSGVDPLTLRRWVSKGRKDLEDNNDTLHRELYSGLGKAIATAEVRDLMAIDIAGQGRKAEYERDTSGKLVLDSRGDPILISHAIKPDWRAKAWKMEKRYRQHWGPAITGADIMSAVGTENMKPEDREKLKEEVRLLAEKVLVEDPDAE